MAEAKSVLFLCGSPKGEASSSFLAARTVSRFLKHPSTFVDVAAARLSFDPAQAEPAFGEIVEAMRQASAIVWVFGAILWHAPVQLKVLFDKCFEQDIRFDGKIAATVLSSAHLFDDFICDGLRLVSEQLGCGYIGDVSVEGVPGGYTDCARAETECRLLAERLDAALDSGYVPCRQSIDLPREELKPLCFGREFAVNGPKRPKTGNKTILVVTGYRLDDNPAARAVHAAIDRASANRVELFEVAGSGLGPCELRQECLLRTDLSCAQSDVFAQVKRRLLAADAIIFVGQCAATFVDAHMLTLIGRTGSMLIMPQLKGKYGFAVATGGGGLGRGMARYLSDFLTGCGVQSLGGLTEGDGDGQGLAATIAWTVEQLDAALEQRWEVPVRCLVRTEHYFQREGAAKFGVAVRGYYHYFRRNKLFDFPPILAIRLLVRLLPGRRLADFLIRKSAGLTRARWEKRFGRGAVPSGQS